MKIAIVDHPETSYVSFSKGGSVEIWIHEVARRLAQSCEVVTYSTRGSLPEEEWCDGVRYRRVFDWTEELLSRFGKMKGAKHAARKLHDFHSGFYYIGYSLAVAKDLRSQRCDIIHIINLSQYAPIFRRFNPKAKIALNMRCEWLTQLDRRLVDARLEKVDLVIGNSEYVTNKIRSAFPRFAGRCQTVWNGTDPDYFVPGKSRIERSGRAVKRLLFVGRISPEKGIHVLIDAMPLVLERFPQAQLEIIGPVGQVLPRDCIVDLDGDPEVQRLSSFYDGVEYHDQLKAQVRSLCLESHVHFHWGLPHPELLNHYQAADVFVFPSISESFGVPVIEAMACGTPVVAGRAGGIPELVVPGKTGLLVERGNPRQLADAILKILLDSSLARSMGEWGRKRVQDHFSWQNVVENLLSQYQGSLSGSASKSDTLTRSAESTHGFTV
jgi:glycosyltransferase involved in cell wall biosynthesis